MAKIDIDLFIASLIKRQKAYKNNDSVVELENILKEQGLLYEDGEILEIEPDFTPEKGKWYVCIKTVVMISSGSTAYRKGKLYKCEEENCITDEQGDKFHYWYSKYDRDQELYKNFRPATDKEILRLAPLTDEQKAYYINGAISSDDEQGIDRSSCTSTKENNKPQTIKFNEPGKIDSVWPKEIVDELLEETRKKTPKVKEQLRKYFANVFPAIYDIDVDKMTRDYASGLLHSGYVGPSYFDRQIAYKRGIEDVLDLIRKGGEE